MGLHNSKSEIIVVFVVLMTFIMPAIAAAAEVVFPVSAYAPEELAEVRQWEKTWAGKKIDKTNIDQVAEFMPASYVENL